MPLPPASRKVCVNHDIQNDENLMSRLTLTARYIFPVVGDPIPNGRITIEDGRIIAMKPCDAGVSPESQKIHNLGNVALLPGLVNAHVHLDFSDLCAPLGHQGIAFVDWIRCVMQSRQNNSTEKSCSNKANSQEQIAPHRTSHERGLNESFRNGVRALGDIAQPDWPADVYSASPLSGVVFQELIAPTAERVAGAMALANAHIRRKTNNWQPSLSPHAPYSVHPKLLEAVIALSAAEKLPVAMHLAESNEEIELLQHGTGPLRGFLEDLGAWNSELIPSNSRPLNYLRQLASAHRALIVHGNYLNDEEIAFLGAHAARMAVVYCPRTHDWFAHHDYPLEKMITAGVTLALGTDGRGSAPDLSLWSEMQRVAQKHPGVELHRILKMGTTGGAKALGLESSIGTLEPGKQANLTVAALPDRDARDPHELLFDAATRVSPLSEAVPSVCPEAPTCRTVA